MEQAPKGPSRECMQPWPPILNLEPLLVACEEASPPPPPPPPDAAEGSEVLVTDFHNLTLNPAAPRATPPSEVSPQRRASRNSRAGNRSDSYGSRWSERSLGVTPPPLRRRGVRTVQSVRRERLARMIANAQYFQVIRGSLTEEQLKGIKNKPRTPFKCPCNFCISQQWDPSENARIGSD